MLESQIFTGFSSNSLSRYITSSSDCCSEPTMGVISVWICVFIMWMEGAVAFRRMPYFPFCLRIFGSSKVSSSTSGMTMP